MVHKRVTSKDIARALNISQSTVSRALSLSPRVTEETRAAVLREAQRVGYQPNAIARGLITQQTKMVGVVAADVTNPFYPEILEQLAAELGTYGWQLLLFNAQRDRNADEQIPLLLAFQVDGVIFTAATLDSVAPGRCRAAGLPLVLLNRRTNDPSCDVVVSDNYAGGRMVADLFVDGGHTAVGFIAGREDTSTSKDREHGFFDALAERGVPRPLRQVGEYTHDGGFKAALALLQNPEPPTAIFCANDVVAIGAIDAARALGVGVPDPLSIVGYDDIPMAGWQAIDLTTIRQPRQQMVRAAVELLFTRIEDPAVSPTHRVFPPELVLRGTFSPNPVQGQAAR